MRHINLSKFKGFFSLIKMILICVYCKVIVYSSNFLSDYFFFYDTTLAIARFESFFKGHQICIIWKLNRRILHHRNEILPNVRIFSSRKRCIPNIYDIEVKIYIVETDLLNLFSLIRIQFKMMILL